MFGLPVGGKALEPPDGDRFDFLADDTGGFALVFLLADAPADRRHEVVLLDDLVGQLVVAVHDRLNESRDVDVDRAAVDALGFLALHAALGLGQGLLFGIAQRDLGEAFDALLDSMEKRAQEKEAAASEGTTELIAKQWPDAITTPPGLQYVVVQEGTGDATPAKGVMVKAHYTGKLLDGTKFDSSYDRGQPIEFPVGSGRVIKGWDEAFLSMKKGEKRVLIIPSDLGYGPSGRGQIPPNAIMVFDVELVDF